MKIPETRNRRGTSGDPSDGTCLRSDSCFLFAMHKTMEVLQVVAARHQNQFTVDDINLA